MKRTVIIGVAGGSGSGKTTVVRNICERLEGLVAVIEQDAYYKDQSHLPMEERRKTNYDHPLAFDNDLLISHLRQLLQRKPIEKPVYDYTQHTRSRETVTVEPRDVILLEGILILEDEGLRALMDIEVFVDTDADLRILRRLERDVKTRGRSLDSVIQQYLTTVRPMHQQFVEPSKRYADLIIPEGGFNQVAVDLLVNQIRSILSNPAVT